MAVTSLRNIFGGSPGGQTQLQAGIGGFGSLGGTGDMPVFGALGALGSTGGSPGFGAGLSQITQASQFGAGLSQVSQPTQRPFDLTQVFTNAAGMPASSESLAAQLLLQRMSTAAQAAANQPPAGLQQQQPQQQQQQQPTTIVDSVQANGWMPTAMATSSSSNGNIPPLRQQPGQTQLEFEKSYRTRVLHELSIRSMRGNSGQARRHQELSDTVEKLQRSQQQL